MLVQSIDQDSLVNLYGNIGKILLSLVSMSFDIIFICQHYVLYPATRVAISPKFDGESVEPLVKSPNHPQTEKGAISSKLEGESVEPLIKSPDHPQSENV
ncbi:hypothetical protein L1049_002938 [Liquidambar formosana]|uniref:Cystinosin n=1 Tax=Liquidambar formosana TaxID=63359 RepID=A0AAP0R8I8_LIQFO